MITLDKLPKGVTISVFQAADTGSWHITLNSHFGTSWVRMNNCRDLALAQMLIAENIIGDEE